MHQQHTYQPFPNFTHPPPPIIVPSLPPVDDSTIEQFLIDRNHSTIEFNEKKIFRHFNVKDGRDRLNVIQVNLNNLIKQQQCEETNLKTNIAQLAPSDWREKINLLKQNQIKIGKLLTKFESSATTNPQPTKRRPNKRKTNKVQQNSGVKEATKRPKIEADLEESYEKYEVERLRTANLKKIHDCRRQLTLLDALIELQCIRRKNANASGSSSDKCFVEQIDQLKSKWTEALAKCQSLDGELKMLSTNTTSQLWLKALFSNAEPPFSDSAMDFQRLLDIR